jgi:hypothetical protein
MPEKEQLECNAECLCAAHLQLLYATQIVARTRAVLLLAGVAAD